MTTTRLSYFNNQELPAWVVNDWKDDTGTQWDMSSGWTFTVTLARTTAPATALAIKSTGITATATAVTVAWSTTDWSGLEAAVNGTDYVVILQAVRTSDSYSVAYRPLSPPTLKLKAAPGTSAVSPSSYPITVTAASVTLADTAGYYTGTDVETVLAEQVGKFVSGWTGNATVYLGDSITLRSDDNTNSWRGSCFPVYASIISGQRIRYVRNAGVSGNTTTQMLARFDTDVTAYSPSVVVIMGGTNDTGNSVALSTIRANLVAIVEKCKRIGALPVLCSIPPNSTGSPATRKTQIIALNEFIARYCAFEGIPFVDVYSLLVDPSNGNYLSTYNNDGTHPNNTGDKAIGQLVSDTISSFLAPGGIRLPSDENDPHNFMLGALFSADTAGLPTSWTNLGGTTGQTLSCVTDSTIKGRWFRYATVASSGQSLLFQSRGSNPAGVSVTPGNRFCMVGRVKPTTLSAGQTYTAKMRFTGGVTTDFQAAYVLDQTITGGGIFYVEGTAPTGSTAVQAQLQIAAGTGQIDFAQIGIYDLTNMAVL